MAGYDILDHSAIVCMDIIQIDNILQKDNRDKFNVPLTSLHSSRLEDWYFDSGCFELMTINPAFFTNFKACNASHVTNGDGVRDKGLG